MSIEAMRIPLVVLVGAFNSQILRDPKWVQKYLFPTSTQREIPVTFNVALDSGALSSNMTIDGIDFQAEPGRVRITPAKLEKADIDAVNDVLVHLASALPHTPLSAYGINFQFMSKPGKSVLRTREKSLVDIFKTNGDVQQLKLESRVKYEDSLLTFSLTERGSGKKTQQLYDFNFHCQLGNQQIAAMDTLQNAITHGVIEKYLEQANKIIVSASSKLISARGK